MKKFLITLSGALLMILSQAVEAAGPTYIKEDITASTTWTAENSPYIIQSNVSVAKGAVLTISPGVEVHFAVPNGGKVGNDYNLVIQGGLRAIGNSTSPISFMPSVAGSLWGAIYFYGSDPANSILQGCLIKGGRVVCNASSPTISQCAIFGAKSGVEVAMNSNPQITSNRITANGMGIVLLSDTASPVITSNEIYNNNYGFYLKDFGSPTITGNKIYSNLKYNMVNYSPKTIPAPNNDFKILDAMQIVRTIYDGAYNKSLGRVNFLPFVGMPQNGTTAMSDVQPTGTQEQPKMNEEDLWSYGRPFDSMKVSNLDNGKQKSSSTIKILAVGATAVVTVVLLFL